ncbi:hypothetical protein EG68_07993 [Paragonimus skrjabini miyazakii]|uniref:Uncharacterized protein n=1 Tax=Paragonimus skrjabini miyazakii TaxID=59628 RepID=A0A8S9YNU4_9TREM|nr:hypothetical protein EG68_07993 [Paragonimus skrjabini miyazakii]
MRYIFCQRNQWQLAQFAVKTAPLTINPESKSELSSLPPTRSVPLCDSNKRLNKRIHTFSVPLISLRNFTTLSANHS